MTVVYSNMCAVCAVNISHLYSSVRVLHFTAMCYVWHLPISINMIFGKLIVIPQYNSCKQMRLHLLLIKTKFNSNSSCSNEVVFFIPLFMIDHDSL